MSNEILISIKPEWVAKILKGEKTLEIRKTAPKCELPCYVYIYCTKSSTHSLFRKLDGSYAYEKCYMGKYDLTGKVVAMFELMYCFPFESDISKYDLDSQEVFLKASCLTKEQILEYGKGKQLHAWEISELSIFDEPKELSEFKGEMVFGDKPPQSWRYI